MRQLERRVHHLGREAIHTYWDNALPAVLMVAPGATVVFDTLDASYGRAARQVQAQPGDLDPALVSLIAARSYATPPDAGNGHPLTGPVAVAGALPGDTLVVEILDIAPGFWGWTATPPGIGLLSDEITKPAGHIWDCRDGRGAWFAPDIRVPLAPFCGVMGVALAEPGRHPTFPSRPTGGNLDIRQLTAGATLYLPIQVPGALFSVGDVHGAQGDGEVSGAGIEMESTVTLRFGLQQGRAIRQPQFRTAPQVAMDAGPSFAATGHDPDLREAAREALRGVLDYLVQEHQLSRSRAYLLASVCVDLRISQIVNAPNWTVSAFLPLNIFTDGVV
jgi:acetamidase/formamidase